MLIQGFMDIGKEEIALAFFLWILINIVCLCFTYIHRYTTVFCRSFEYEMQGSQQLKLRGWSAIIFIIISMTVYAYYDHHNFVIELSKRNAVMD